VLDEARAAQAEVYVCGACHWRWQLTEPGDPVPTSCPVCGVKFVA
jgi:rubrerythrin